MQSPSRRKLLKAAILGPAAAAVSVEALKSAIPSAHAAFEPAYASPPARFLTTPEHAFVEAAVARIIPADDLGPGAKEAGVANFIDHQLAGPYGRAEGWYMQGPWRQGVDEQGYQLKLTPAQLYRAAIAAIDRHVRQQHHKTFAQLDAAAQEAVLDGIDKGEIDIPGVPVRKFFEMLVQNTVEGFFADPIYGGNRDFIGWRLIGFPGPRYNYIVEIGQYGRKYDMPFVSLSGRDAGLTEG
jgi:gluconate 2-dehydrogenase gamma chain